MSEGRLASGWEWASFSEVANIASNLVDPSTFGRLPHIAPDNIERDTGKLLPFRTVAEDKVTSPKHRFRAGQILYSKIRPYLNKCVRATFDGLCSADMYPIEARIDASYLRLYILSRAFVEAVTSAAGSRTILPKTNQQQLAGVRVPVPPLREARRIVEIVDSELSRLDAAAEGLKRVEANLKRYRASVLKAAVEGRLVPTEAELAKKEGRSYEPASVLLDRILTERRLRWEAAELAKMKAKGESPRNDKWKARYAPPVGPDIAELPALPEGWCWTTLGQLAWSVKDGPHYSPEYSAAGVPFITGGNVRAEGVDFAAARKIAPRVHEELCKRTKPERGDLLYTKGGTTGIARVNTYDVEFSVWVHVAVLKLPSSIDRFYLQHALNSLWCYRQAQAFTHGVGNQDLGLTRMVKITVPLPPLAEQARIVQGVERYHSDAIKWLEAASKNASRVQRLRQSILKWAFEGKLVDQDPNDEPASVLVARIKAEREKDATTATPRRGATRARTKSTRKAVVA